MKTKDYIYIYIYIYRWTQECAESLVNQIRAAADAFRLLRTHQSYWTTDWWTLQEKKLKIENLMYEILMNNQMHIKINSSNALIIEIQILYSISNHIPNISSIVVGILRSGMNDQRNTC